MFTKIIERMICGYVTVEWLRQRGAKIGTDVEFRGGGLSAAERTLPAFR